MTILAIETATRQMGIAAIDGEQVLASYELLAENPHAVELPDAVTRVLKAAHTTLAQVKGIVVDIGPGSFTGLRIGLAFVKALVFPTQIPLVGVPSLDVLASNLPFTSRPVCPVLDAKQKNVYAALYRPQKGGLKKASDYFLGPIDDFLGTMNPALSEKGGGKEPTIFLGDGCSLYRERILERCPEAEFASQEFWLPKAATLARLGAQRLKNGTPDDPSRLVPMYLYPLDCSVRGPDRPTSVLPKKISQPA